MNMIDIHSHFLPRSWPDLAARFGTPDWPWLKATASGDAMLMVGEREFRPVTAACWDPAPSVCWPCWIGRCTAETLREDWGSLIRGFDSSSSNSMRKGG